MFCYYYPDVDVGTWWATRIECNHANIHRPTVAGIHPGPDGAYSIALSGGYEDDIDMGDCFTYTGEGTCSVACSVFYIYIYIYIYAFTFLFTCN